MQTYAQCTIQKVINSFIYLFIYSNLKTTQWQTVDYKQQDDAEYVSVYFAAFQ